MRLREDPMKFTLRQLAVFDEVARLGSVSKAAAELHLTQSAASMALRSLESALGRDLFLRQGKRLVLGEHGRLLQPMARSILASAQEMDRVVSLDAPREDLTVGASPTVADFLLDEVVSAFMAKHPRMHVSVSTLPSLEVIKRVDEMSLDVGLVEMVTVRGTIRQRRWRSDSFVIFCSPWHALAHGRQLTSEALAGQSWCLQPRLADSRRQFTYALLTRLETIDVTLESDSIQVIKAAVAADVGLGCLPRPCVTRELEQGALAEVHVTDLDLRMPFSIITRKGLHPSPAHEDFIAGALSRAGAGPSDAEGG